MPLSDIDPVTFEVVWHRILDATEEMGIKYMRTSGSPVLVGAYDASTGIALPDGQLVAMGPYITTQAHVLPLIIRSVRKMRFDELAAGDMYICNDPYLGATHQPDVATVAPIHVDGELAGWVGSSGHWLDIGGSEPGGFNMNARSVYDEGLRLPPTRIVEGGRVRQEIVDLIMNHIREPLAELDMRGQMVANRAGIERMTALFDDYGVATVRAVMTRGIDYVEERLRARLRALPDSVWREVQYLDHDGHEPNVRRIVCTASKRGDQLTLDFAGSDPQVEGFANCAIGGLRAAALSGVCIMLGFDLTWNDGISRCVTITAPPGTVVSAEHPSPVSMSTISSIIVTLNAVFGALSKMLLGSDLHEQAMANWCGTSLAPTIIGRNSRGTMTVLSEASHFGAGCGARTYADGVDTGGIIINTTANVPSVESTEAEYPVLYLFRRQLTDSGGPGMHRGGVAGELALVPYDAGGPLEASFAGVGSAVPNAYGLAGGLPGATARYVQFPEAGVDRTLAEGRPLPTAYDEVEGARGVTELNHSHAPFGRGSAEYHSWQGGGGYGDPLLRAADAVTRDVRSALVSQEVAFTVYGVVVNSDGECDAAATGERRAQMRLNRMANAVSVADLGLHWPELPFDAEAVDESALPLVNFGSVVIDGPEGHARCATCDHDLGPAREDFRRSCVGTRETPAEVAGPTRGEDYPTPGVELLCCYCPGCAQQLDVSVVYADEPSWTYGFR